MSVPFAHPFEAELHQNKYVYATTMYFIDLVAVSQRRAIATHGKGDEREFTVLSSISVDALDAARRAFVKEKLAAGGVKFLEERPVRIPDLHAVFYVGTFSY